MKILKIIGIVIINIFILLFIVFLSDLYIYNRHAAQYNREYILRPFKYFTKMNCGFCIDWFFTGGSNVDMGRLPVGTEYKTKPIVIFGCSFAHGQFLDPNQTFDYKLSQLLKRPVYNRAIPGRGLQHMYMQLESEEFYRDVPVDSDYIYVFHWDQYRRLYTRHIDILDWYLNGNYVIKNNKLVFKSSDNPITTFLMSSYTYKLLNAKYAIHYVNNPKNAEKITDFALFIFTESRRIIEEKAGHKIHFNVFIYDNYPLLYKEMLTKKLRDNGFNVFSLKDITDEDMNAEKYVQKGNSHPTEAVWDLLTPKIVEKLELSK